MPRQSDSGRKKASASSRGQALYSIGIVAERYDIHPQTLRLYEREGLLTPSRSRGKTRLYSDEDLERLEIILALTRDLGVNLAGVEVVLHMRGKMLHMREEIIRFMAMVQARAGEADTRKSRTQLVRLADRQVLELMKQLEKQAARKQRQAAHAATKKSA